MGVEIERKFLVTDTGFLAGVAGTPYRQGYLSTDPARVVRVRTAGNRAYLTIKGRASGASRPEYEYAIPSADAEAMLDTLALPSLVEKTRHRVPFGGLVWEVDVFHGANDGLIVAEVELPSEDFPVDLPPWAGAEVTDDERYYNANLAGRPYASWPERRT